VTVPANLITFRSTLWAGPRNRKSFKKNGKKEQLRKEKQQEKECQERAERRTLGGVFLPSKRRFPLLDGPVIFEVDEADLPWDGTPRVSESENKLAWLWNLF